MSTVVDPGAGPDPDPGTGPGSDPGASPVANPRVGPVAGPAPTARAVRRWTTQTANSHGGARLGELLSDVYYTLLMSLIGFGMALGVAAQLRASLPERHASTGAGVPNLLSLVPWALLAGIGAVLSLAGRLGPVGVGGAEATWLLGMPVGRQGLLRPAARRLPLLIALVAGAVVGVLDAGLLADRDGGHMLRAAAGAALVCAGVVLLAGFAQSAQLRRRTVANAGDVLVAAAPVLALLAVVLHWGSPDLLGVSPVAVLALVVAVVVLVMVVDARLGRIPARSLREGGSVASQAAGALVSMDSRELGRALTDSAARTHRRRVRRFRLVRGPVTALLMSDVMVLVRSPRHMIQVVLAALGPVLVAGIPQLAGPLGFIVVIVGSGYVAASATAEGSRRAQLSPALDRLLPLDAKLVRRLHQLVPVVVMLGWSVVAYRAVGTWAGDTWMWVFLGVAATPVWSAAAIRAAFRTAPNWGGQLVSTPMGALPGGVATVLARGPDVVVLGLIPTTVAIVLGRVTPVIIGFQLAFGAIAFAVASSIDTRSLTERFTDPAVASR